LDLVLRPYQLLLKTGVKLKVSLSGYRLLKERLGI